MSASRPSQSPSQQPSRPTARFGRTKSGLSALTVALPIGIILALVSATVAGYFRDNNQLLYTVIQFATLVPPLTAIVWTFVVDRDTLTGAVRKPEFSIEDHWYTQAAAAGFHTVLLVSGVAAATASFAGYSMVALAFLLPMLSGALACLFTYQLNKSRG